MRRKPYFEPPAAPPGLTAAPLPDFWAWLSVLFFVADDAPMELAGARVPMLEQAARAVAVRAMANSLIMEWIRLEAALDSGGMEAAPGLPLYYDRNVNGRT